MNTRTKSDNFDDKRTRNLERKAETGLETPTFLDSKDLLVIMAAALIAKAVGFILGNNTPVPLGRQTNLHEVDSIECQGTFSDLP